MAKTRTVILFLLYSCFVFSQSLEKGDIILNANYGVPHLFKTAVKVAAQSESVKKHFEGYASVDEVTGLNPISIKGEYGISKFFGLGFSAAFWNINILVRDYYNVQNQGQGQLLKDSVDTYSFKISSKSYGLRPNLHIPLKSRSNSLFIGMGLGLTKNKLTVGFSSTDIGRVAKVFKKDLEYDLSLPGGVYIAPTIGYRHYFGEYAGLNLEVGYEKGAIVQMGAVFRFNPLK